MKMKQIALVAMIAGLGLTGFALYEMKRISDAKGIVSSIGKRISSNPFGRAANKGLMSAVSQYDTQIRLCLIGGIVLAVGGFYFYRKHR
ncbi:MAG: hypothetical protein A3E80_04885 [Chlamydiae bacterium RIFCSPHIGHO2_12_FULL_49_9]|nr:MAG: hypothetical protein A3E80_04885 [Chlamydiae bacterium RIFCSPHIGHO2_12_FULL_49_9]